MTTEITVFCNTFLTMRSYTRWWKMASYTHLLQTFNERDVYYTSLTSMCCTLILDANMIFCWWGNFYKWVCVACDISSAISTLLWDTNLKTLQKFLSTVKLWHLQLVKLEDIWHSYYIKHCFINICTIVNCSMNVGEAQFR